MSSSVINFLNRNQNSQTFNSSGSFTVPLGITRIQVLGAGGGGGGAGGNSGGNQARGGGAGAVPQMVSINVTPGDVWTVTIGSGGSAGIVNSAGGDGGNSSFRRSGIGPIFSGAAGAPLGSGVVPGGGSLKSKELDDAAILATTSDFSAWNNNTHFTYGGGGDQINGGTGQSGQDSPYASGGNGGTGSDRGGGGGAGFGAGGNGSSSTSGTATSGGLSAGGGGGGGGKQGGEGGSGRIIVFW